MVGDNLAKDFVKSNGDLPVGIVRFEFRQIGDVTDVVALAVLLDVFPVKFLPGHFLDFGNGLEHGDAVLAAATKIVDLSPSRRLPKLVHESGYVMRVDVVADLLALISEDLVLTAQ